MRVLGGVYNTGQAGGGLAGTKLASHAFASSLQTFIKIRSWSFPLATASVLHTEALDGGRCALNQATGHGTLPDMSPAEIQFRHKQLVAEWGRISAPVTGDSRSTGK